MLFKRYALLHIFLISLFSLYGTESGETEASFYIKSIFTTGGRISGYIADDPRGGFLAFSEDRYLYSFFNNGELRARKKISGKPVSHHAQGFDGVIYKYFDSTVLKAINMKGDVIWSVKNDDPPAFSPIVNSMGNIITISDSKIISYSYMGRQRWEIGTDISVKQDKKNEYSQSRFFSTPLIPATGGIVYVGMSDGTVIAIDNYGQIIRTAQISATKITALCISNNKIIISDENSNLFIRDLRDLKNIRSVKLRSPASHIATTKDGNVIIIVAKAGNMELFDSTLSLYPVKIRGYGFTGASLYFGNSFYFIKGNGFILKFDINKGKTEEIPIPFEAVHGFRTAADNMNMHLTISAYKNMIIAGGLDWNIYLIEEREYKNIQEQRESSSQNSLFTANSQNDGAIVPDTKYLLYINELSQSEDLANRENAFELLDQVLLERITGNDERYILSILGRVAFGLGGVNQKASSRGENSSVIRTKTALIAAKIRTIETVNILRNMLSRETDPFIASIIIKELGEAGSDPYGESVRLFERAFERFPNNLNVIENIIMGIKNINIYQGYFHENGGKNLLFKMLERSEKHDLKLKIMDVLKTLDGSV